MIAFALLAAALDWRSPLLASYRTSALAGLIVAPASMIAVEVWLRRRNAIAPRWWLSASIVLVAAVALVIMLAIEGHFRWQRTTVLAADPAELERLGQHLMVGYRDRAELLLLLERQAIGGVFVSARNVEGRSSDALRNEIASWQELRRRQGLPPLLIASDQEGGSVSRLSPPLPRQPPLAGVTAHADESSRNAAAHDYGMIQGRALASLGVNINFAPVVDIDRRLTNPGDRHTRISQRAISNDPTVVTAVARHYCRGLAAAGVSCTIKHFPGLGDVYEDTHLEAGYLRTPLARLEAADWLPFRTLMAAGGTLTMLSHARLTALDAERPASFSATVVDDLLRRSWRHAGVLVTDDFSMYAVYSSRQGIGGASVAALAAGVDLILIAYDPALYYPAMTALLEGARAGALPPAVLAASVRRLRTISVNR